MSKREDHGKKNVERDIRISPSAREQVKREKDFIARVIAYYEKSGRHDLLWRKDIHPYKVLVSEIMLQQTQVARVLPKFEAWMKKYPTLKTLRESSLLEVLKLWQGLGYQRRAKALFTLAQENNKIPKEYERLLLLNGVGVYTASAVSAFAYNLFAHPVLETNIRTALIEQFHHNEVSIKDAALYEDLARLVAHKSVQDLGARYWYYALMDYGAYLKSLRVSHNKKSAHHSVQSPYKGSLRELRAKVLFSITHGNALPNDKRTREVLEALSKEKFITKVGKTYRVI